MVDTTNNSILTSVKKILGITEEYTHFDPDIILHINSVFTILHQLGVGPEDGFSIVDKSAVWTDFLDAGSNLEMVKTYICARVRMLFDPPASSVLADIYQRIISEFEWRLNVAVDPGESSKGGE